MAIFFGQHLPFQVCTHNYIGARNPLFYKVFLSLIHLLKNDYYA